MNLEKQSLSYNDALLMAIFSSHGSCGPYHDILFLAELCKLQRTAMDRIRAMFTATEATFWLLSHHATLVSGGVEILGKMAKECYLFLKISTNKDISSDELHYKLHQSFGRWEIFMSQCLHLLQQVRHLLLPLGDIKCDSSAFYNAIQQLHHKGFGEIELFLDRTYAAVLYGNIEEARAGFPIPSDLACSVHEGARRRRVRRLLNDAGVTAPSWPSLHEKMPVPVRTSRGARPKSRKLSAMIRRGIRWRKGISERVKGWLASEQGRILQISHHSITSCDTLYEEGTEVTMKHEDSPNFNRCPEC